MENSVGPSPADLEKSVSICRADRIKSKFSPLSMFHSPTRSTAPKPSTVGRKGLISVGTPSLRTNGVFNRVLSRAARDPSGWAVEASATRSSKERSSGLADSLSAAARESSRALSWAKHASVSPRNKKQSRDRLRLSCTRILGAPFQIARFTVSIARLTAGTFSGLERRLTTACPVEPTPPRNFVEIPQT